MRRDLNSCSRQSAMHHGVRVRVFFRRSSEHHSRNDSSSSSSTSWSHDLHAFSWSHDLHAFSHISIRYFSVGSVPHPTTMLIKEASYTHSAEVRVLHTPVEVRFSMTCFVHVQGKRANVHIPAIMSVTFPDVVFDGLI